jgi:protein-tyrosine phosphatase
MDMASAVNKYIVDRFGSRRGLLNYSKYSLEQLRGVYKPYTDLQWPRVQRFIFICQGNICRSPLAWGYAQQRGVATESFGTSCRDGLPADPRAIDYAAGLNIDLGVHRTRGIGQLTPLHGDLLVVMEPAHLPAVAAFARVAQITLAGLWLPRPHPYVHDPYSSNLNYFRHCEDKVVKAVNRMLELRGL